MKGSKIEKTFPARARYKVDVSSTIRKGLTSGSSRGRFGS